MRKCNKCHKVTDNFRPVKYRAPLTVCRKCENAAYTKREQKKKAALEGKEWACLSSKVMS